MNYKGKVHLTPKADKLCLYFYFTTKYMSKKEINNRTVGKNLFFLLWYVTLVLHLCSLVCSFVCSLCFAFLVVDNLLGLVNCVVR